MTITKRKEITEEVEITFPSFFKRNECVYAALNENTCIKVSCYTSPDSYYGFAVGFTSTFSTEIARCEPITEDEFDLEFAKVMAQVNILQYQSQLQTA